MATKKKNPEEVYYTVVTPSDEVVDTFWAECDDDAKEYLEKHFEEIVRRDEQESDRLILFKSIGTCIREKTPFKWTA